MRRLLESEASHPLKPVSQQHTMAKTEAEIAAKAAKKEKKDKKRKHDEVEDSTPAKKDKKEKKRKSVDATTAEPETQKPADADGDVIVDTDVGGGAPIDIKDEEDDKKPAVKVSIPLAALVPFANPLCDEKAQKKVLKGVKKGTPVPLPPFRLTLPSLTHHAAAKNKALKRGVKECVKAIRKSAPATPATQSPNALPPGIVVLAADISPMDVISHIPVLCEDHSIPYVYVPSRAELGAAGSTKRPTSIVMISPKGGKKDGAGEDEAKEWDEVYRDLHKLAVKLGQHVKV